IPPFACTEKEVRVANTKSALKRMRQNEKRRVRNRAVRSRVRTAVKSARTALEGTGSESAPSVIQAIRELDRAVTKGVIHRNTAARKKSALARRLAALHRCRSRVTSVALRATDPARTARAVVGRRESTPSAASSRKSVAAASVSCSPAVGGYTLAHAT